MNEVKEVKEEKEENEEDDPEEEEERAEDDDDDDVAFASVDFTNVDFDDHDDGVVVHGRREEEENGQEEDDDEELRRCGMLFQRLSLWERRLPFASSSEYDDSAVQRDIIIADDNNDNDNDNDNCHSKDDNHGDDDDERISRIRRMLSRGDYIDVLRTSDVAKELFSAIKDEDDDEDEEDDAVCRLRRRLLRRGRQEGEGVSTFIRRRIQALLFLTHQQGEKDNDKGTGGGEDEDEDDDVVSKKVDHGGEDPPLPTPPPATTTAIPTQQHDHVSKISVIMNNNDTDTTTTAAETTTTTAIHDDCHQDSDNRASASGSGSRGLSIFVRRRIQDALLLTQGTRSNNDNNNTTSASTAAGGNDDDKDYHHGKSDHYQEKEEEETVHGFVNAASSTSTPPPSNNNDNINSKRSTMSFRTTTILKRSIELELLGIAALNLFMQLNYTGPSIDDDNHNDNDNESSSSSLKDIHPHHCFMYLLQQQEDNAETTISSAASTATACTTIPTTHEQQQRQQEQHEEHEEDEQGTVDDHTVKGQKDQNGCDNHDDDKNRDRDGPASVDNNENECDNEADDPTDGEEKKEIHHLQKTTKPHTKQQRIVMTAPKRNVRFQNNVLAELAVDGEWPVEVCSGPYFLLLARAIFETLSFLSSASSSQQQQPATTMEIANVDRVADDERRRQGELQQLMVMLTGVHVWHARACVAHERLLQTRTSSVTLWNEVQCTFQRCIRSYCDNNNSGEQHYVGNGTATTDVKSDYDDKAAAATVMLEWGLAQHHFDQPGKGRTSFLQAQQHSGLSIEVTGAEGRRTKFQWKPMAQMLVRAQSANSNNNNSSTKKEKTSSSDEFAEEDVDRKDEEGCPDAASSSETGAIDDRMQGRMVQHSKDEILLERVKYENEHDNEASHLSVLDQSILLAMCLDVKNSNPNDGLTAEEMGAYLARVLDHHHDDWMVYSTALLERAWLEYERSHSRERSVLQMQALADQHTSRLTATQSTIASIEEDSAPVQERLRTIHGIVYPPRWSMIQDMADRYSSLGIVVTAATLYTEIEAWDDVVDCYRRSGRVDIAESIVRERLAVKQTPRMWSALGDITNEPQYHQRAIELSKGRYYQAYESLGAYYFEKGNLSSAAENYEMALKIRPLATGTWFRLGTISMQLGRWERALAAFSVVVQQEPETSDAWANVAAVHSRNKKPSEAYPALSEAIRHDRNNWRIWVSKLYVCLDLEKYDEAIQACNVLLDLRDENRVADGGVPELEEKCVRAIVGGTLTEFRRAAAAAASYKTNDECGDNDGDNKASTSVAAASLDSSRRSLSRVHALLGRVISSGDSEPWVFEAMAYFHEHMSGGGDDDESGERVLGFLMKEFRALQAVPGWEKDDAEVRKTCRLVSHIVSIHRNRRPRRRQQQNHNQTDSGRSSEIKTAAATKTIGRKEGLIRARFLVRGVVKSIQTARPDDLTLANDVKHLENLLGEVESDIRQMRR